MFEEIVLVILDKNAGFQVDTLQPALARGLERALAEDKALRLSRDCIPFYPIHLPNTPSAYDCYTLAEKIRAVAQFERIPKNQNQALWMRRLQMYWQVKAIRLANLVFPVIPDPLRPGTRLFQILASKDIENLKVETNADKTLYDLLKTGEPLIIDWAKAKGIDWPFQDYQELFIHILKTKFKIHWQEEAFSPVFLRQDKKSEKKHYRQWLKFLSDDIEDESLNKQHSKVLMDMGWEGYPLLALRPHKRSKPFGKLWKAYLKAHKAAVSLIDDNIHFKNGEPYQTKQTSQKAPLQGRISDDGHIYWVWS